MASQRQNYINHIALVLDASTSMIGHSDNLVKVADGLIQHLAQKSQELDQETRVTVYTFSDDVQCVIYDKDVLRLPSISKIYRAEGNTALIAATMKAQEDLAQTAQLYGDHAFLTYVLTDGEENVSQYSTVFGGDGRRRNYHSYAYTRYTPTQLRDMLAEQLTTLDENWTVAVFVPNRLAVSTAKTYGFPADNIAVWDATRVDGVLEVGKKIIEATDTYMTNRTRGIRGSKTIFAMGADQLNRDAVKQAGLKPLARDRYQLVDVRDTDDIRPFVERITGREYVKGSAYYQLMKPEKIQPQKLICVRNRKSGRVYTGAQARELLGLPDHEVRVKPEANAEYQVFVQSTSVNRRLVPGTKLLVMLN